MPAFSPRAQSESSTRSAPDAVGRGVMGHDPAGPATLFVLAGHSMGSTPVGIEGSPQWLDLRRLVSLDALGDPIDAKLPIEAEFDGGPTIAALWPEPFCDQVIDRLRELLEAGEMIPEERRWIRRRRRNATGVSAAWPRRSDRGLRGRGRTAAAVCIHHNAEFSPRRGSPLPRSPQLATPCPRGRPPPSPLRARRRSPRSASRSTGRRERRPSSAPGFGTRAAGTDAPLWAAPADERPLPGDGPPLPGAGNGVPTR